MVRSPEDFEVVAATLSHTPKTAADSYTHPATRGSNQVHPTLLL
jgi:hypothetical protein